jgi:hypothetical protein
MKSRGRRLGGNGREEEGREDGCGCGPVVCGRWVQQQQVPWGAREQEGAEGGGGACVWCCCDGAAVIIV